LSASRRVRALIFREKWGLGVTAGPRDSASASRGARQQPGS
jgi:hypothetical protein